MLDLKSTVTSENFLEGVNSTSEPAEERISELEDRSFESLQSEEEREKECIKINRASEICEIPSSIQT